MTYFSKGLINIEPSQLSNIQISYYILGTILLSLILIINSIKDIKEGYLTESICRVSLLTGLTFKFFSILFFGYKKTFDLAIESLLASIAALLLMLFIALISKKITSKTCLGMGDVKIAAVGGMWLNTFGIMKALTIGFLLAGSISLIKKITSQEKSFQPFPFVPYISFGIFYVWIIGVN